MKRAQKQDDEKFLTMLVSKQQQRPKESSLWKTKLGGLVMNSVVCVSLCVSISDASWGRGSRHSGWSMNVGQKIIISRPLPR